MAYVCTVLVGCDQVQPTWTVRYRLWQLMCTITTVSNMNHWPIIRIRVSRLYYVQDGSIGCVYLEMTKSREAYYRCCKIRDLLHTFVLNTREFILRWKERRFHNMHNECELLQNSQWHIKDSYFCVSSVYEHSRIVDLYVWCLVWLTPKWKKAF